MARTVRDTNLGTRTARANLPVRKRPYYRLILQGLHLPTTAEHATRMAEKHYAHLTSSYVGETIRAAFGQLDLGTDLV